MNSLTASIFINLFFFTSGVVLINVLKVKASTFRVLILSYPLGIGTWSLLWMLTSVVSGIFGIYNNGITTHLSIIFTALLAIFSIFIIRKHSKLCKKHISSALSVSFLIVFLTALFHSMKTTIILGDSFAFITWSYRLKDVTAMGFPGFGLAVSNLSAFFIPDYYNYSMHTIISVCLTLLVFDSIRSYGQKWIMPVLMVLTMVTTNNFIWHSIYVNYHNLTAFYILSLCIYLNDRKTFPGTEKYFLLLLLFFISLIRMEGILLSMSIIAIFLHRKDIAASERRRISFMYSAFSLFYVFYLSSVLWNDPLFSAKKYAAVWCLYIVFVVFSEKLYKKIPVIINYVHYLITGLTLALFLLFLSLNPSHLWSSTVSFILNTYSQSNWGITTHLITVFLAIMIFMRMKSKKSEETDRLLMFYILSVLLILILSNFRPPYSVRWLDTGNRMLFHFLPLGIVWMGRKIQLINSKRTTS